MKVYVLYKAFPYEGANVVGIYLNEEKAMRELEIQLVTAEENNDPYTWFMIAMDTKD